MGVTVAEAREVDRGQPVQLPLAVSMGDPAGIGLDILLSAWTGPHRRVLPRLVLIGDPDALAERAAVLRLSVDCRIVDRADRTPADPDDRLAVLPVRLARRAEAGHPDPANAPAVIEAIERAVAETVAGHAAGLVTAPISKATVYAAGFPYPGHTEFLAALASRHFPSRPWTPVMMLAADELRVVPATVHVPLAAVPGALTRDALAAVCRITARDLAGRFGIARPRLAVAGLNPHAGEGGAIGREEIEIIGPAIEALREEGFDISGPHSADTLFHAAARSRYDAAICMYHDQALIPLKTLAFDTGVNVTLGLPFVRTSPDHGTACDIAGTGRASPASFMAALRLAAQMTSRQPNS